MCPHAAVPAALLLQAEKVIDVDRVEDGHGQAQIVLQLARWMAGSGQCSKEALMRLFDQVGDAL